MLVFLFLCALLRTLHGAPVAPPAYTDSGSLVALEGPELLEDGTHNFRTRFTIVQSCFLTIFACVWKAIHPNINGETDSGWTRLKRKITTTLVALIAPELILYWALSQRSAAKEIAAGYNAKFAEDEPLVVEKQAMRALDLWRTIRASLRGFIISPLTGIRAFFQPQSRDDAQRWTTTHGFFIQMGGFMLYKNGQPTEVLDYARLVELVEAKTIDRPIVTERELLDRSKGDPISKTVVVWQTTWFALQCCARLAQHLPLSELEVVTLAFTVVNVAIYAAWWNKPQSVDTAIRVPWKGPNNDIGEIPASTTSDKASEVDTQSGPTPQPRSFVLPIDSSHSAEDEGRKVAFQLAREPHTSAPTDVRNNDQSAISQVEPDKETSWLHRKLLADHQKHPLIIFLLLFLPLDLLGSLFRPFGKIGDSPNEVQRKRLRMPMFSAGKDTSKVANFGLTVVGFIFGAIHFITWRAKFPSQVDQVLWHFAAIVLIALPIVTALVGFLQGVSPDSEWSRVKVADTALKAVVALSLIVPLISYIPARLVVIILALKAVRHPPERVLEDISWTSFIPHL